MVNREFYIVNNANQYGCINIGAKGDELAFTPYIKEAKVFKNECELESIINIASCIAKNQIQKRYVEKLNNEFVYGELDLYIIMDFRTLNEKICYFYNEKEYVEDIKDIDLSKCTCIKKVVEEVKKSKYHWQVDSKILRYTKRNKERHWVYDENNMILKSDIIGNLFDIIGAELKLRDPDRSYNSMMYNLLKDELMRVIDNEKI